MEKEKIIFDLDAASEELEKHLLQFSDDNFNRRSSENTWSAAELAEHLLLTETRVNHFLQTAVVSQRPADLKIIPMEQGLANREKKYVAPETIHPSSGEKDLQQIIANLKEQREILKQIIQTTDLSQTTEHKHPVIGDLTRLEWVYFNIYHAKRHICQIDEIREKL